MPVNATSRRLRHLVFEYEQATPDKATNVLHNIRAIVNAEEAISKLIKQMSEARISSNKE